MRSKVQHGGYINANVLYTWNSVRESLRVQIIFRHMNTEEKIYIKNKGWLSYVTRGKPWAINSE